MASNERIMILKMLEEGKIGADEAAKLIAAVGENEEKTEKKMEKSPEIVNNGNGNNKSTSGSSIDFDELGRTVGNISRDLAKKVGIFAKDMAPKVQSFTETLVEKTVEVTDKISKSTGDITDKVSKTASEVTTSKPKISTVTKQPEKKTSSSKYNGLEKEKSCELSVSSSGIKELYIPALNGGIFVKGYNGDKITAKIKYKSSSDDIQISQAGGRYYLDYDENIFETVSVEAYVPEKLFERVQLSSVNGPIKAEGISPTDLILETINGTIQLKRLICDHIKLETMNGMVNLENIVASEVKAITTNAKVSVDNIDVQKLILETCNAQLDFKISSLSKYRDYNWNISTSNAGIRVNVPIGEVFGYDIEAETSLNRVMTGITGLNYIENDSNYIKAKSINFETAIRKINMKVETSNGPININ